MVHAKGGTRNIDEIQEDAYVSDWDVIFVHARGCTSIWIDYTKYTWFEQILPFVRAVGGTSTKWDFIYGEYDWEYYKYEN